MSTEIVIIEGIRSGDCECWCLDVTKETFVRIMGREPNSPLPAIEDFPEEPSCCYEDSSWFNKGYFKLYPDDIFSYANGRAVQIIMKEPNHET